MSNFDARLIGYLAEINQQERLADNVNHRVPFYWSENIDSNGRHKNPTHDGHRDWDFCDTCGGYDAVAYWYGGFAVAPNGEVVPKKQVPLCKHCAKEELQ